MKYLIVLLLLTSCASYSDLTPDEIRKMEQEKYDGMGSRR